MVYVDGRVNTSDLKRVGLRLDGKIIYPVQFFGLHLGMNNLVLTKPVEELLNSRRLSERLLATQIYDYFGDSYDTWTPWSHIVIHLKQHKLYGLTLEESRELHHFDTFIEGGKTIPLCVGSPYKYDPRAGKAFVDSQRDEMFYNTTNWGVCACKFPVELQSMTPLSGAIKGITVKNHYSTKGLELDKNKR